MFHCHGFLCKQHSSYHSCMEDILLQPLESGKPNREGRGMGLYIVQQLMRSFSADIQLLDERNKYGNKFKFLLILNIEEK